LNVKPSREEKFSNYAILGRYVKTPAIFDFLENTPPGHGGENPADRRSEALCKARTWPWWLLILKPRYDTGNLKGFLEATIDFALQNGEIGPWLREFILNKAKTL
jgi:UTP--glucose-1-phosphate uridylyltransferase